MKVLFSNPPWWDGRQRIEGAAGDFADLYVAGVRAGSRWPFTHIRCAAARRVRVRIYLPYPFFMGYATTYAARETDADVVFRDSIALRESYHATRRSCSPGSSIIS